jgi:hypothetical protein
MQPGVFGIVTRDLELFSSSEDEQNEWDPSCKYIEEIQAFLKNERICGVQKIMCSM